VDRATETLADLLGAIGGPVRTSVVDDEHLCIR
jgi:hypothetical protein